jgi:hypothetical protein
VSPSIPASPRTDHASVRQGCTGGLYPQWLMENVQRKTPIPFTRIGALCILDSLQTSPVHPLPSCPGVPMVSRCLYQKARDASSETARGQGGEPHGQAMLPFGPWGLVITPGPHPTGLADQGTAITCWCEGVEALTYDLDASSPWWYRLAACPGSAPAQWHHKRGSGSDPSQDRGNASLCPPLTNGYGR